MILHCTLGTLRHILAVNLPNTILIAYSTVGSSRVGRTIPDMYDSSCHITKTQGAMEDHKYIEGMD